MRIAHRRRPRQRGRPGGDPTGREGRPGDPGRSPRRPAAGGGAARILDPQQAPGRRLHELRPGRTHAGGGLGAGDEGEALPGGSARRGFQGSPGDDERRGAREPARAPQVRGSEDVPGDRGGAGDGAGRRAAPSRGVLGGGAGAGGAHPGAQARGVAFGPRNHLARRPQPRDTPYAREPPPSRAGTRADADRTPQPPRHRDRTGSTPDAGRGTIPGRARVGRGGRASPRRGAPGAKAGAKSRSGERKSGKA